MRAVFTAARLPSYDTRDRALRASGAMPASKSCQCIGSISSASLRRVEASHPTAPQIRLLGTRPFCSPEWTVDTVHRTVAIWFFRLDSHICSG